MNQQAAHAAKPENLDIATEALLEVRRSVLAVAVPKIDEEASRSRHDMDLGTLGLHEAGEPCDQDVVAIDVLERRKREYQVHRMRWFIKMSVALNEARGERGSMFVHEPVVDIDPDIGS